MKQLKQRDLDQLARYIDDELDAKDRASFERLLGDNDLLREKYVSLLETHRLLKVQPMNVPSKNFTDRVMQHLDLYTPPGLPFSIRNGVLLLTGVLIAGALALYLVSHGAFDGSVTISSPLDQSLTEKLLDRRIPAVSFDGKLVVNAIVLVNLALAWIVLDRTILRPLFNNRRGGVISN